MIVERVKADLSTLDNLAGDLLAVATFADERPPQGLAGLLDWRLPGRISRWMKSGFYRGAAGEQILFTPGRRLAVEKVLLIGGGEFGEFARRRLDFARAMAGVIAPLRERDVIVACDGATPAVAEALRGSGIERLLLLDLEPGRTGVRS
jgi:hypothetical protein